MASETHYPLVVYREWMRPLRLPAFAIAFCLAAFGLAAYAGALPGATPLEIILLGAAAAAAFGLWLAAVLLPRAAFVACRPDSVMVRIGLLQLVVSFARVRQARTVQHAQIHSPRSVARSLRALAIRLALRQCIALELTSYPTAFFLLRALTHPFFFLGDTPGFLFAVDDWMGLGRELEQGRASWLEKRHATGKHRRIVEDIL